MLDPLVLKLVSICFGLLFLLAAVHKLTAFHEFRAALAAYELLPDASIAPTSIVVPICEALLGAAWLLAIQTEFVALASVVLLGAYTSAIAINLSPVLAIGWPAVHRYNAAFVDMARRSAAIDDPSLNAIEPPRVQNQSVVVAAARYLQSYPPGHPLHSEHPLFVQFGDLEPRAAKQTIHLILLSAGLLLAWRFRRKWRSESTQPRDVGPEWAVVCVLCALLSLLCWLQHLVLNALEKLVMLS